MAATNEKIKFELTASDQTSQAFNAILGRLDQVDQSAKRSAASIGSIGASVKGAFAGLSIGFLAKEAVQLADSYNNVSARLKLVTNGTSDFLSVQKSLFNISQSTRVDLTGTVDLYSRMARASQNVGVSQESLLKVTDGINKALIISGANGQSAQAALVQLSQGFASGALRGQELNSVMEQTPRITQAVQRSLKVTEGDLRTMAEEGKLTTEVFIKAFLEALPDINREFASMPVTVSQAMNTVKNSILMTVGEIDKATGASNSLSKAIIDLSKDINDFGKTVADNKDAFVAVLGGVGTAATLGVIASRWEKIAGVIAGLATFAKNPVVLAILGLSAAVSAGTYLSRINEQLDEQYRKLAIIDEALKKSNIPEWEKNELIKRRISMLEKIKGLEAVYGAKNDQSDAESQRLLGYASGSRAGKQDPIKSSTISKDQQKLIDNQSKFMQDLTDKLVEVYGGEKQLFMLQASRLKFSEDKMKVIGDLYDQYLAKQEKDKTQNKAEKQNQRELDAAEKSLNYLEKYRQDMDIITEQIALKNDGVYRTAEQQLIENARLQLTKKYNEEIVKIKNLDNLTEQGKLNAIAAANIKYQEQLDLVAQIAEQRKADQQDLVKGISTGAGKYFEEVSNLAAFTEDATTRALRGMEDMLVSFVQTGKLSFRDLANSIIANLIRIQMRQMITAPLAGLISGSIGSAFSPVVTGTSSLSATSADIMGRRAMGGPVTGGNSYLVGENGPEIFTPGASGGITPNNQISGGGVTVVQTINVTTGVQQTVRAEIMNLMPQIAASAKSAVADAKLRGGSYANALR